MYKEIEKKRNKEGYIKKQAEEVVKRNKGRINRFIKTLDDLILFYSIFQSYKSLVLDFQYLKTQLQIERIKYTENKTELEHQTESEKDYINFVKNYEGYWKNKYDKLIEKFLHKWKGLKYLCRDNDDAWEYWLKVYKEYNKMLNE